MHLSERPARILLVSHAFHPSIGGLERTAQLLAEQFSSAGHQVCVVTASTTCHRSWDLRQTYSIVRCPSVSQRWRLLRWANLVHVNGASLPFALLAVFLRKPMVITHQGYQLVSVDGLGWGDQGPTPLEPSASLAFYRLHLPVLAWWRQCFLLWLRRWVACRASANVAITRWVARRQPLPHQSVIHNPVALPELSSELKPSLSRERPFDCLFLGRLVQEKGLDVLLHAMHALRHTHALEPSLLVVGDGPMRSTWKKIANDLDLSRQVRFVGSLRGKPLVDILRQARIGVVPSVWEEPMGLVAIELLAAGLVPVVSSDGGLAECIADAGLTVPNGDPQALATVLAELLTSPERLADLQRRAPARLIAFAPERIASQYLDLFRSVSGSNSALPASVAC